MTRPDVIVVGGGIVGAACADSLSEDGLRVLVLEADSAGSGATAAGMGHVVVMDDNEAEFALTRYSRELWDALEENVPREAEFERRGTLWVAADAEELEAARRKQAFYCSRGISAELLDEFELRDAEPNLHHGLAGGLYIPGDGVTYPPPVARWLLSRAESRGSEVRLGTRAVEISDCEVTLERGERVSAPLIVCAGGAASSKLLPWLPMQPRKGHLAITDRYPGFVNHQLVELGYLKSAHGSASESVAFNVQPRSTGQVLIGSSRQFGATGTEINHHMLAAMLSNAIAYMPGIARLSIVRAWTGFRAATPDKLPLIGRAEGYEMLWLATGHEGLGITTSLATGQMLADLVAGRKPAIDPEPYSPARFSREALHA